MVLGKVGPGDDVEAWCTKCRMNLNHRIIAMLGSIIQRVQCLTCNGEHKYYPPKEQKVKAPKKSGRVSAADKAKRASSAAKPSPDRARGEWTTFMKDMPEGENPRPYKTTEAFKIGAYIAHPVFGTGRVLDIVAAEKMEVIFEEGRKILIFNKTAPV